MPALRPTRLSNSPMFNVVDTLRLCPRVSNTKSATGSFLLTNGRDVPMTGRWPWGFLRLIMGEITCSLLWARVPSEPTLEHDPRPFGATVKARSEVEEKAARRAYLHRHVVGLGRPLRDGGAFGHW